MTTLLQIAAGGALGAVLRYLSVQGWTSALGPAFPAGTLFVNAVGSFLIGLAYVGLGQRGWDAATPFLVIGVLGGFTTFSAFSLDTLKLVEAGQGARAAIYVIASVSLSLAAVFAGVWAGRSALA